MADITSSVGSLVDNIVTELFTFGNHVIDNYVQEILLLLLLSVMVGFVWAGARRFLGRR